VGDHSSRMFLNSFIYRMLWGSAKLLGYVQATDNQKRGNKASRPVSDAR